MRISILTSTYNRAEKLFRLYQSLEKSTFRDFEWIIIDDGSSDNTEDVIARIKETSSFPVTSYYQNNSGKHISLNKLFSLAKGEYCFDIDDDDELLPDAMEKGLKIWDEMNENYKEKCWCVCGRCIDSESREIVGPLFPDSINEMGKKARKKALSRMWGEKFGLKKTSVVSQYKFPELRGCGYFPEGYLWGKIDEQYHQYYTNETFRVYYQNDGVSLINHSKNKEAYKRRFTIYNYLLSKNCIFKIKSLSKKNLRTIYFYKVFADKAGVEKKEIYSGLKKINIFLLKMLALPCFVLRKMRKE